VSVVVLGAVAAVGVLAVEVLRWTFRPEARRLRVIRKLKGRR
jgi:hypothetical protein